MNFANILVLIWSLNGGYTPEHVRYFTKPNFINWTETSFAEYGIEAQFFETFYFGNKLKNEFIKNPYSWYTFIPIQSTFTLNAGFRFQLGEIKVDVGYEHMCSHPDNPAVVTEIKNWSESINAGWNEAYDRFTIQLSGKLKMF